MSPGQDWCLQCGAAAPGSVTSAPSWRSAAAILGATALLVAGAAGAAYAAWGKPKAIHHVTIIAQVPNTTTSPAAPGSAPPATPKTLGTPTTVAPTHVGAVKPPKIPQAAATPQATPNTTPSQTSPSTNTSSSPSVTTNTTTGSSAPAAEQQPTPIALDTNAASTYNPYNYPASRFGDPSLAIDGDTSTAWTAQVDPAVAPKMAQGLAIDLKTAQKLSVLALVTSTPGMTVQVYGANGSTLPASITDPAWVQLSPAQVENGKHAQIKLRVPTKAFRFVTLWISKAPAASVGTAQAPGHVSLNEVELFPA